MRRGWLLGVLVALLLAAFWRLAGLSAEFWFDEVLSLGLAREADSPLGVFSLKHDNNHHLNTLWLAFWPDGVSVTWYRLHAVVARLAAVVVAALAARRWGGADAAFAAFLFAGNCWLVIAATEARGYSLAVLFALAAFAALWLYLDGRKWRWLLAFWLAVCLGFLSHLSFVHAYLGFVVWSLRRFARQRRWPGDELRQLVVCHLGIAAFFVPFYLLSIRGMHVEGGRSEPIPAVIARLLSVGLGGPDGSAIGLVYVAGFAVLLAAGLWLLNHEGSDVWVFFAVAVLASPAVFLLRKPPFLYERYFLISFSFFLLLLAHVLGALWRAGGYANRGLAAMLLLAYLGGNGWHLHGFAVQGRGQFTEALAWVLEHDPSPEVLVTGDQDFRVGKMVEFHVRYVPGRKVVYVSTQEIGRAAWVIAHPVNDRDPHDELVDRAGNRYELVRAWPSRWRWEWGWFVYRRVE